MISTILTQYRADASDHIAELKKLKGAEAERAKETIAAPAKVKSSLEDPPKAVGKVSLAIAGVAGAFVAAKSAMNAYAENARLTAASAGVSIDRLAQATKGLKTEHELLTDAARLNNGAIKLNTEQMAIAEQAMIQFTRRGIDNAKAHDAVLQAVTALKVDGLKDLGVFVDMTGLSMEKEADRGKILQRVFGELTKASSDFANSNLTDAEKIEANANRITNAIDRLKVNAGKGVAAGIGAVEGAARGFGRFIEGATGTQRWDRDAYNSLPSAIIADATIKAKLDMERLVALRSGDPAKLAALGYGQNIAPGYATTRSEPDKPAASPRASAAAQAAITAAQALARFANASVADTGIGQSLGGATTLGGMNTLGGAAGMDSVLGANITAANENALSGKLTANWKDKVAGYQKTRETFMESTFGPVGQFDAYKQAFDGFTGAVTAGYGAMVDGTMSFGKAFKQAVAQALKATGAQMLIESLKEAAYGIGSLAIGNGAGAAAHFKSSALFLAGSVAAGVAANQLGGGGASAAGAAAGGGAGGGAPAAPRPAQNENAGQSIVYVVGDPYDTETNPRRRQNNAKKLVASVGKSSMGGAY